MASLRLFRMPKSSMLIMMPLAPRKQLGPLSIILTGPPPRALEESKLMQRKANGQTRLLAREEHLQICAGSFEQKLLTAPKRVEAASRTSFRGLGWVSGALRRSRQSKTS